VRVRERPATARESPRKARDNPPVRDLSEPAGSPVRVSRPLGGYLPRRLRAGCQHDPCVVSSWRMRPCFGVVVVKGKDEPWGCVVTETIRRFERFRVIILRGRRRLIRVVRGEVSG
jgi:hypothetical protein